MMRSPILLLRWLGAILLTVGLCACKSDPPAPTAAQGPALAPVQAPPTSTAPPPVSSFGAPLATTLETLFPNGGRDDLRALQEEVATARAALPKTGLAADQTDALGALLVVVIRTLPEAVSQKDAAAVVSALDRGFGAGLDLIDKNLTRFWQLKTEADTDDGAAMPADVEFVEAYDRNARMGSALAGLCARGMGAFLEHGDLPQRTAAHAWFARSYTRAIQLAGGAPVLAPTDQTPPAHIVATGHAGKLAELLDAAAGREQDEALKAQMRATVESFRKPPTETP